MARRGLGGLQSNPLLEDDEREEAAILAAAQAAGNLVRDLPAKAVAPDPENPQSRLKPDGDLINSVRAEGQLVPGVVVPIDVWTSYGNDPNKLYIARAEAEGVDDVDKVAAAKAIAKANADIEYVIIYGHRRWAGVIAAGKEVYRAVVTNSIKDNTTKRIHRLIENLMRSDLTPLEEAEEFYRLLSEDKLTQREIERRIGIKQSYVSKRVALRRLPESAKQALAGDKITVEVANELAKISDDAERIDDVIAQVLAFPVDSSSTDEERQRGVEARNRFALDLARRERASYDATQERAKLCQKLVTEGVRVIDPDTHFKDKSHPRYKYRLHTEDEITAARKAGTVLAYVHSRDQIEWYTEEPHEDAPTTVASADEVANVIPAPRNAIVPTTASTAVLTEEQRLQRQEREYEQREKIAANEARNAACLRITSKAPSRDQLIARLARRVLMCEAYDSTAQELVGEWLTAAGIVDAEIRMHTLFGDSHHRRLDSKILARVAYVYDLALDESHVRKCAGLDSRGREHIERLTKEAGYMPSSWEQRRLNEFATTAD